VRSTIELRVLHAYQDFDRAMMMYRRTCGWTWSNRSGKSISQIGQITQISQNQSKSFKLVKLVKNIISISQIWGKSKSSLYGRVKPIWSVVVEFCIYPEQFTQSNQIRDSTPKKSLYWVFSVDWLTAFQQSEIAHKFSRDTLRSYLDLKLLARVVYPQVR
jgi:hypothetical protein